MSLQLFTLSPLVADDVELARRPTAQLPDDSRFLNCLGG